MNKKILSLVVLASMVVGMQAKVKLHHLVSDNMIIQQQQFQKFAAQAQQRIAQLEAALKNRQS